MALSFVRRVVGSRTWRLLSALLACICNIGTRTMHAKCVFLPLTG